jgi:hypothetical protein
VQGAMVLAKRFPRNPIAALDNILTACQRPGLAERRFIVTHAVAMRSLGQVSGLQKLWRRHGGMFSLASGN